MHNASLLNTYDLLELRKIYWSCVNQTLGNILKKHSAMKWIISANSNIYDHSSSFPYFSPFQLKNYERIGAVAMQLQYNKTVRKNTKN